MFKSRNKIVAPRIVQQESTKTGWWLGLLLVACAAVGWFAFDYGRLAAGLDIDAYDQTLESLQGKLAEQQVLIDQLRLESASHERSAQIDGVAAEEVRKELVQLQQTNAELNKEIELLNGLLSDKTIQAAIQLEHFEIVALDKKDSYRVRFKLVHLTKTGGTVKGHVTIKVSGKLAEDEKTYTLDQLAPDGEGKVKLGFKNFQKIDIDVELPADFHPETLLIETDTRNKNLQGLNETLNWELSES